MRMKPAQITPKTVAEYVRATPKEARVKLRQMRACVRAAAPGATESIKWGMPAVSYRRILVMYAAFKRHIGFYPTASAVQAFSAELSGFKTAKGSIQFPLDRPLPLALIRRIAGFRVRESRQADKKWRV